MFKAITLEKLLQLLDRYDYMELVLHHGYIPYKYRYNGDGGASILKTENYYHTRVKSCKDTNKQAMLLPDGRFVMEREFGKVSSKFEASNSETFSCEILGQFDVYSEEMKGIQETIMIELIRYFYNRGCNIKFYIGHAFGKR